MWRAALQLSSVCAALSLLRWAAALPTGACPTDSRGPGDIREIRCVGLRVPGAVDCTVEEESGAVHRSRLRLSGWGTAPLVTQLFNDRPRLVKQLEVTDSDLSSLSESAFRGLGSAQLLRLNGNQLSAVPEAALGRLPLLQTLVMNNNRIHRLLRHQLSAVPCLKYLSLAENGLRTIEPGALPAGLRHVGLKDNQLRTLNGTVRHLDDMKWLFVSNNELTSLDGQLPVGGALSSLMAYGNRLTSLDGVQDAAHLKLLNVNYNRLTQLDGRLQLPRLKKLHLSHNQIRQVSADQLSGFPALRELTLDDNELSELDPILSVLPNLTKLNISYNQLSSIAELAQTDRQGNVAAHPLQELFAVGNRITAVGQLNLPKLLKLNLSDNDLTEVSAANFAGMPSLEVLVLSGNRLQRIGQLLEALPALTRADFSDNSITSVTPLHPGEQVPHETKPRLLHLQTLLLNNNRLRLLDVSLYRLPALCVLDVRNNTISRLRWHQHKAWRCSLQHRKLRVNGNPVHCEDQEVRLSLRQAAQNFTLDVALCGGGGGPAAQVAPLSLGAR